MNARVALLDSGGANLGSVQAAFARLGVEAPVTSDWNTLRDATHVVLPTSRPTDQWIDPRLRLEPVAVAGGPGRGLAAYRVMSSCISP